MICLCSMCIRTNRFTALSGTISIWLWGIAQFCLHPELVGYICHVLLRWFQYLKFSTNESGRGHHKVYVCTLWKYQLFRPFGGFLSPLIAPQSAFLLNHNLLWLKVYRKCVNTLQRHLQSACTHSSLGMHCNLVCFWYKRPASLMWRSLTHLYIISNKWDSRHLLYWDSTLTQGAGGGGGVINF
jgi:hypothetical protein